MSVNKPHEIFDKYAEDYQGRFMNVDIYKDGFDLFLNSLLLPNAKILELACGPGNITKYLLDKNPQLQILGSDLAPNMIKLAQENNPNAEFIILDANDILSLHQNFDGIICGFCMPYLSKNQTEKLINNSSQILNKNGLLYLSTMEGSYGRSGIRKGSKGDDLYMYFYEADFLEAELFKNNFKILHTQRIESIQTNGDKVIDLILVAQKK